VRLLPPERLQWGHGLARERDYTVHASWQLGGGRLRRDQQPGGPLAV